MSTNYKENKQIIIKVKFFIGMPKCRYMGVKILRERLGRETGDNESAFIGD